MAEDAIVLGAGTYDVCIGQEGTPKGGKSTDKLGECYSEKGGGVKKSGNIADVISTCPLAQSTRPSPPW